MIPIPPYIPSWSPVPVVTPFTYRDGVTMLKKVDGIIRYLNRTIVPFINETNQELADKVEEDINNMINVVNTAIATLESETDTKLADMQQTVNDAIAYVNTTVANLTEYVDTNIADLTTYVNEQVQLIINDGIQVQDPVMKGIIQNPASQTRGVLDPLMDTTIHTIVDPITPDNNKRAVGKGELVINARDYGYVGDNTADDTAAIQAAIDAAAALVGPDLGSTFGPTRGASVYIPRGVAKITTPLKLKSGVSVYGDGKYTTRLHNNVGNLFEWTSDNLVFDISVKDIWLSTGAAGGHVFNIYGAHSGGMARSSFQGVKMSTQNATSSIWKQRDSAQLIDIEYIRCVFDTLNRTVPAFDISVEGRDANSIRWEKNWCHSHMTATAPFWNVGSNQSWLYNLSFVDNVGEQNNGGWIYLYAVDGFIIDNCPDWDNNLTYDGDIIRISTVGARSPKNGVIKSSYRIGNAGGLAANVMDYRIESPLNRNIRIMGASPSEYLSVAASIAGDVSIDGKTRGFQILTADTTIDRTHSDELVINSANPVTITLPAPINCMFGQQYNIKNVGAGLVTLVVTIDGVNGKTLATWEKIRIRTDGANANFGRKWFSI